MKEYLTFRLGKEDYGIDILKVQEIRSYEEPTRIANAPPHIKGVVNMRGVIVPIVDLRIRLNTSSVEYNDMTVAIILNVHGRVVGVVVDGVSEVMSINPGDVSPAPDLGSVIDSSSITGLAQMNGKMLILLDIERLMNDPAMSIID